MTHTPIISILVGLGLSLLVDTLRAEESRATRFGSPNSVENLIEDDASKTGAILEKRISEPWFEWKKSIQEEHGLSLGFDYSAVTLKSNKTGTSCEDNAAGGMLRFYGSWDLAGKGTKNTEVEIQWQLFFNGKKSGKYRGKHQLKGITLCGPPNVHLSGMSLIFHARFKY